MLGLVLPTLALPVMPDIIQGAAAAAHEHGYLLTISEGSHMTTRSCGRHTSTS